ncbi:clusterin-associated protein 1 [Contarinia nasturtii]|uniref:clusterin-associated protein 1 n=1 Tax=Contarinia nasturtii TaxID=265458 RepID=UPI0012D3B26C|nr:clusterin-associated protein 1 [Contarinia nasturtii]
MSYKEVRDLFEYLKILGYPKPLKLTALYTDQGSLENFKLIFDILRWLIDQYEPGTILLGSTDSEMDRTLLVRSTVEFLVVKAGIKLNPMRLYASSMVSAPELLKVVNLIMKRPTLQSQDADVMNENQYRKVAEIDIDDKIKARQRGRELSSELTQIGATLYDLLGKENENQEKRNSQAGRQMESSNVGRILSNVIASANVKVSTDKALLDSVLMERQAISAKIERRKADLERLKQRLDTLQKIRPAFSEEFEKAEEELEKLYVEYLTHIRCLDALRAQMSVNAKVAQPLSEASKSSAPASMILLPDGILDFSDELSNDGDDLLDDEANELKLKRPTEINEEVDAVKADKATENDPIKAKLRIKTGVRRTDDPRLIGTMLGEEGESDFDSSLDYNEGEEDSDDSDLNLENDPAANVEALYNFSENVPARIKSAKPKVYQSDEDF